VLGGAHKPRLPAIERLLPEIYAADAYAHRVLPYKFAPYYAGGLSASGNRLFIMTTTRLYCIGDPSVPYDWNPKSREAK
jgi:hypothetical protein